MKARNRAVLLMGFVLSISLIAASVLAIHIYHNNVNHQMERLVSGDNTPLFALGGFVLGIALLLVTIWYREKVEAKRIQALTDYLEQINTGGASILTALGEDKFSKLEDEIYKTVTHLLQTKEAAVQAKSNFARNLENIAHQLKTPITALSLTLQTIRNISDTKQDYELEQYDHQDKLWSQMEHQLQRLIKLEDALLLLSRLDAGTLELKPKAMDVYTVLVLAADNLQELLKITQTEIDIPELGEMAITADLDWTMEAVLNLMKNCMEHNPGGVVHCTYAQNLLYTEILIWDEGKGFAKEDIPHLFERFYRGRNACGNGLGIGLALSKEILERQNGTLRAWNRPEGGACFEIHLYSH